MLHGLGHKTIPWTQRVFNARVIRLPLDQGRIARQFQKNTNTVKVRDTVLHGQWYSSSLSKNRGKEWILSTSLGSIHYIEWRLLD